MNLLWDRKEYDCEIKDFVIKQDLQFKLEFKLSDGESAWTMDYGTTISKFENGFQDLSDDMDLIFHDFTYKDAKACMAKNCLEVHKSIITARSPESLWDDSGRVQVPVCESDMFHVFINYLYTGKMLIQPGSELHNLEYLARKWNLDMLKKALRDLILL
ncbi:hypothetical protein CEXT_566401 [Caerostris extrusa]|uniref:BTB domain-containing protein n=1 Tax=Caerostris extrusa TaxID=172846 RepID=A0AAV4UN38_CAEEX|nr:hypothetical protein CEXT_566401 [Caerostris extrusa]